VPVVVPLADYDVLQHDWHQLMLDWRGRVEKLRASHALLNYFTINHIRSSCSR